MELKKQIVQQQQKLEAQQEIIEKLNRTLKTGGDSQEKITKKLKPQVECWKCGEKCHIKKQCFQFQKMQGNESVILPKAQGVP